MAKKQKTQEVEVPIVKAPVVETKNQQEKNQLTKLLMVGS